MRLTCTHSGAVASETVKLWPRPARNSPQGPAPLLGGRATGSCGCQRRCGVTRVRSVTGRRRPGGPNPQLFLLARFHLAFRNLRPGSGTVRRGAATNALIPRANASRPRPLRGAFVLGRADPGREQRGEGFSHVSAVDRRAHRGGRTFHEVTANPIAAVDRTTRPRPPRSRRCKTAPSFA